MKDLNFTRILVGGGILLVVLIILQLIFSPQTPAPTQVQELNQEPEVTPIEPGFVPEVGDWDFPQLPYIYEVTPHETATFTVNETTSYTLEEPTFLVEILSPQGLMDFNDWLTEVFYPDDAKFELIYLY